MKKERVMRAKRGIGPMGLMGLMGLMGPMGLMGLIGLMSLMGCAADGRMEGGTEDGRTPVGLRAYTAQTISGTRSLLGEAGGWGTRQVMAEDGIPDGGSIGIYAYYHQQSTWADDDAAEPKRTKPDFMFNQEATYIGVDDIFLYSPLKFWPNTPGDKLSFIAYFPYCNGEADDGSSHDIESTGITPLMTSSDTGRPSFNVTVKENVDDQIDFLVSDLLTDQTRPSISDRVCLYFQHATSKVTFRIIINDSLRKDVATFRVNNMAIRDIYRSGTYGTDGTYSGYGHKTAFTVVSALPAVNNLTKPYLMLPQKLAADDRTGSDPDAELDLDFSITFRSYKTAFEYSTGSAKETETYTYSNSVTLKLKDLKQSGTGTPITEWLPGRHYVYTLRLGARQIGFTGLVVDWGQEVIIDGIEVNTPELTP